ncbi:hypothetical protein [Brevundimonas sp.]|uniref:hypothetical protein n=1 Tax=Brevundimonas sp. TaxID=1871086 RepID=UPI002D294E71|nr:hypothetical protein [Brevundimonas sp.]HYC66577.1 hypothetical protein [Brevundimonas sp.]
MADREDLDTIIAILREEGFDLLAGELLMALEVRRNPPPDDVDFEVEVDKRHKPAKRDINTDTEVLPAAPSDDAGFALAFIAERLVEPAFGLAWTERAVGELTGGEPVAVRFVDRSGEGVRLPRGTALVGDETAGRMLEAALRRVGADLDDGAA